jgi:hypothetical protein
MSIFNYCHYTLLYIILAITFFGEICFPSCHISTYKISLILHLDPQSLKCLQSVPLQEVSRLLVRLKSLFQTHVPRLVLTLGTLGKSACLWFSICISSFPWQSTRSAWNVPPPCLPVCFVYWNQIDPSRSSSSVTLLWNLPWSFKSEVIMFFCWDSLWHPIECNTAIVSSHLTVAVSPPRQQECWTRDYLCTGDWQMSA